MKGQGALMSGVRYREILRLSEQGLNESEIARACGCARSTVQDYVERARAAGLTLAQIRGVPDSEVLLALGKKKHREQSVKGPSIDWAWVATELRRPGVTLALLWAEKVEGQAQQFSYSSFCRRFQAWEGKHEVTLRQVHHPGEKIFVDYSGLTLEYVDRETGEVHKAQIFVGTLGASNLTYVEASASQSSECWLGAHIRMCAYFGGVSAALVPDNLKSGVTKACRYEPELNRAYHEFAEHYGTAILPARSEKPKDKAKVEKAVRDIQSWLLAPLRDQQFYSVAEINEALQPLLEAFNARTQREYGVSRRALFEQIERSALKPLPTLPFQIASWKQARVNIDYHIEVERHYYSVPYYLVRKAVEVRISEKLVEMFFDGQRCAVHPRSRIPHQFSTLFEHMPPEHQAVRSWSKEKFVAWSQSVGLETAAFVATLFQKKAHPEQAFRAVLGLQRLAQKYGSTRLEAACKRGNHCKLTTQRSIRSILETNKDKLPLSAEEEPVSLAPLWHANLRGQSNFH